MNRHPVRGGTTESQEGRAGSTAVEEVERGPRLSLTKRVRHADLSAVAEVRKGLRELLWYWGAPGRADVAELLASELVTNALVHTMRGAVVTATLESGPGGPGGRHLGRLRFEVRDFASRHPTLRARAADDETSGRGLLLVHSLSDAWGVRSHGVGKALWFELEARPV
jgi:anti-sigma regulatory factor (Ser/Thr protein kinase)